MCSGTHIKRSRWLQISTVTVFSSNIWPNSTPSWPFKVNQDQNLIVEFDSQYMTSYWRLIAATCLSLTV